MPIEWERVLDTRMDRRTAGKVALATAGEIITARKAEAREIIRPVNVRNLMFHETNYYGFRSIVEQELTNGHMPLSEEDRIKHQLGEITLSDVPYFHPTLDDGLASQLEAVRAVQDIERATGVKVPLTLFVIMQFMELSDPLEKIPGDTPSYNDFVHRYLTRDQIIELLKQGVDIEQHTVHHPPLGLSSLSPQSSFAELRDAGIKCDALWTMSGRQHVYKTGAYPEGIFTATTLQQVQELGYPIFYATDYGTGDPEYQSLALTRIRES